MQADGSKTNKFGFVGASGQGESTFLTSPNLSRRRRRALPEAGVTLSVANPAIKEVMDTETGEHLSVEAVIGSDYATLIKLRMRVRTAMHQDEPLYRCSTCFVPVYLCCHPKSTRFYFKHREEFGNCPAITRGTLTHEEINALKYNGAKESKLHLKMKDWVVACLKLDDRFQGIAKEATWKGSLTREWRRPDVRATYQGIPIAFEIQLSTTYLDVIVDRRQFYLQQGGLLFWIFAIFDNEHGRMTDDDVFYNNNQNLFIVNSSTVANSLTSGRFMLECVWSEPTAQGGASALHRKLVGFDELTLEPETQRAYYFDFDGQRQELSNIKTSAVQALSNDFEAWWEVRYNLGSPQLAWSQFVLRFKQQGLAVPADHRELDGSLLTALYSAKHNRPFGQRKKRLVEVAHHVATAQKHDLTWFMHAVRRYGHLDTMAAEGDPGKWADKYRLCRTEYKTSPALYEPSRRNQQLVEFLFPELGPLP